MYYSTHKTFLFFYVFAFKMKKKTAIAAVRTSGRKEALLNITVFGNKKKKHYYALRQK